jgi:hypothetical protein
LIGLAAALGIFGTIRFAYSVPRFFELFRWLFSRHSTREAGGAFLILYLIQGISSLIVMAGAWWCFLREPAGVRALRWGALGLTIGEGLLMLVLLFMPKTGLIWRPVGGDIERVMSVIFAIQRTVYEGAAPVMLLAVVMNSACRNLLLPASEGEPAASEDALPSDALDDAPAAIAHIRGMIAWVILAIGSMGAVIFVARHGVYKRPVDWAHYASWSIVDFPLVAQMFEDLSTALLLAGGAMLRLRKPTARALILAGGIALLTYRGLFPLYRLDWKTILLSMELTFFGDFQLIVVLAVISGLLTRRAFGVSDDRETLRERP